MIFLLLANFNMAVAFDRSELGNPEKEESYLIINKAIS